jgi:hypothetical protein
MALRPTRPAMMAALASLALAGCNDIGPTLTITGSIAAGTLIVTGKTPQDYVAGWITGMDCSSVRYEQRRPWCVPHAGPPPDPPYCTRTLGSVDCWATPPPGAPARGVADPARFAGPAGSGYP